MRCAICRRPRRSTSGRPRERADPGRARARARVPSSGERRWTSSRGCRSGARDARLLALHAALGGRARGDRGRARRAASDAEFAVDVECAARTRGRAASPAAPVEVGGRVVVVAVARQPRRRRRLGGRRCRATPSACCSSAASSGARSSTASGRARRGASRRPAMADADPLAEVLVDVACPACGDGVRRRPRRRRVRLGRGRARGRRRCCARSTCSRARTAGPRREVLALGERRRARVPRARAEGSRVSDFLSRVAARAVGAGAGRAAAAAGASSRAGERAAEPRSREEIVAGPRRRAAATPSGAEPCPALATAAPRPSRGRRRCAQPPRAVPARAPRNRRSRSRAERTPSTRRPSAAGHEPGGCSRAPDVAPQRRRAAAGAGRAPVRRRCRSPVPPRRAAPRAPRRASVRARGRRPWPRTSRPVRVHIGRLEVRANLQQPPPTQRRAREPRRRRGSSLVRLPPRAAGGRDELARSRSARSAPCCATCSTTGSSTSARRSSPVKVTAVAPDTIKLDDPDAPPSLNLFLYRTSRNQGWAEVGLPSFDGNGTRVVEPAARAQPALPADRVRQRRLPGRDPARLRDAPAARAAGARPRGDPARRSTRARSAPSILPPAFQALTAADLADQLEAVTITRRADGHRGDVAALVGDPGALPADRRRTSSRSC